MTDASYRTQPVRVAATTAWVKAAARCGIRIQPILQQLGIAERLRNDPAPLLDASLLAALMRRCVAEAEPPHYFPLVAGESFVFEQLPALEIFLATCSTARHAASALPWINTALSFVSLRLAEEDAQTAALEMHCDIAHGDAAAEACFVEMSWAAIARVLRLFHADPSQGVCLQLRHALPPGHQQRLQAYFGIPVRGLQSRNALVFRRAALDRPLLGAVPPLNQQARVLVERQLPPPAQASVGDTVRAWLLKDPARLAASLTLVADRLQMHPRTLQRRLNAEAQPFAELRDACRRQLAEARLRQTARPDLERLSEQLGFTDRHSFTRAFKRWTGQTPMAWHREHAGRAAAPLS